jgi:hypothetical protein
MAATKSDSYHLVLAPDESPDWGYARNRRIVLMGPSVEWVQSVFSCEWEADGLRFIAPNRDYPYEGLLAHHAGENWKFIDCIGLALRDGEGRCLPLDADATAGVRVTPWRATYSYVTRPSSRNAGVRMLATYSVSARSSPHLATACFDVHLPGRAADVTSTLLVQPLLDIRHMYAGADFGEYRLQRDEQLLQLESLNRRITFHLPPGELIVFDSPQLVGWSYKLGTGCRQEVLRQEHMETRFIPEQREVAAFFRLEIPLSPRRQRIRLIFSCGLMDAAPLASFGAASSSLLQGRRLDRKELRDVDAAFHWRGGLPFKGALVTRIVGLRKFKTYVHVADADEHVQLPHAGAWWFRTPWYRDVFEGLSNSFETLMRFPEERENVRQTVLQALRYQDPRNGLIQARLPEFATLEPSYNSSDATLLCLLVASRYLQATGDSEFARQVLPKAVQSIACFRESFGRGSARDGPPRLDPETGLLLSVPSHSWIDTRSQVVDYAGWRFEGLPNRVSQRFVKDLYEAYHDREKVASLLGSPCLFLPEINAQWIRALAGVIEMIGLLGEPPGQETEGGSLSRDSLQRLWAQARESFKTVFWNPAKRFLFNAVDETRRIADEIECEAAVTAASMLERTVFTDEELHAIWSHAERSLLVFRTLQRYGSHSAPFGLLTRNEDQRVYYSDGQYHGDVVWPRSTPYLVRLLRLLGDTETARALLINNLDHQMTEGAIFYNQELLSRPCGNNPRPCEPTAGNPVPVKNPIQFWSQWCDPFLEVFEEQRSTDV